MPTVSIRITTKRRKALDVTTLSRAFKAARAAKPKPFSTAPYVSVGEAPIK